MAINILNSNKFSERDINERVSALLTAEPYTQEELGCAECDNMFAGMEMERIVSSLAFNDLFGKDYEHLDKADLELFLSTY